MRMCLIVAAAFALGCGQHEAKGTSQAPPVAAQPDPKPVPPCNPEDGVGACEAACDAGVQESCAFLGLLLLRDGQHDKAEPLLTRACAARIALGCGGLGSLHVLRKAWEPAREYLERGCSMGDGLACESLGGLVQGGGGAPAPADVTRALQEAVPLYRRACELGATRGCGWVAAAIADGAIEGTLQEALELYVKACGGADSMPIACRHAVGLLHRGSDESRQLASQFDVERLTADLLSRGCELGDTMSCELLSQQRAE